MFACCRCWTRLPQLSTQWELSLQSTIGSLLHSHMQKTCAKAGKQSATTALQQQNQQHSSFSLDADVAAEAAVMQSRCAAWVSSRDTCSVGHNKSATRSGSNSALPGAMAATFLVQPKQRAVTSLPDSGISNADTAHAADEDSSICTAAENPATSRCADAALTTAHAAAPSHAVRPKDVLLNSHADIADTYGTESDRYQKC